MNLNLLTHCPGYLLRPTLTSQISRLNTLRRHILYTLHQQIRRFPLPKPPQHLHRSPERADRVRDTFPNEIKSAAVDRLEHAWVLACGVKVGGGCDADAAGQGSGEVGEDVGVEICGDDGVEGSRLKDHAGSHGVDEHPVHGHVWEISGDGKGDFVPENEAVALGIAFRDDGEKFPGTFLGFGEGEAHDALDAVAGEDGDFGGGFPGETGVGAAALAGVFAFAVLADDEDVEILLLVVVGRSRERG